jgi:hypothetical protein
MNLLYSLTNDVLNFLIPFSNYFSILYIIFSNYILYCIIPVILGFCILFSSKATKLLGNLGRGLAYGGGLTGAYSSTKELYKDGKKFIEDKIASDNSSLKNDQDSNSSSNSNNSSTGNDNTSKTENSSSGDNNTSNSTGSNKS